MYELLAVPWYVVNFGRSLVACKSGGVSVQYPSILSAESTYCEEKPSAEKLLLTLC